MVAVGGGRRWAMGGGSRVDVSYMVGVREATEALAEALVRASGPTSAPRRPGGGRGQIAFAGEEIGANAKLESLCVTVCVCDCVTV